MRLLDIAARNFRSIEDVSLAECGDLNVLIGRNNSGKSNLLGAIKTFFQFFTWGEGVATDRPPVAAPTDWFMQEHKHAVRVTATLALNEQESESLREFIATETPQMRNALDDIPDTTALRCTLMFSRNPSLIGYIEEISFVSRSSDGKLVPYTLFEMQYPVAEEIATRNSRLRTMKEQIEALGRYLQNYDSSDWRFEKEYESGRRRGVPTPSMRRLGESPAAQELMPDIQQARSDSSTVEEFQNALRGKIDVLVSESGDLRGSTNENMVDTFAGQSRTVPEYVEHVRHAISKLKVHHLGEERAPIGENEARAILLLKVSRGQAGKLRDLQWTVKSLLGVEIDAYRREDTQALRGETSLRAELDVDEFLVQVNGSGIRHSLRLMLDYEFERPDILLIEEPEVYLHPALESALLQYLRQISEDCQVFLTTHSTNFLDAAEFRNVYLVTRPVSTQVQLLNMEDAEEAIPRELGIRLSSLFMYDRLVFVEGPSDEHVLREFAKTLEVNLAQAGVGFITIGGARNFTHYASGNTLAFLAKRRVQITFILDRDERSSEEVDQLHGLLAQVGSVRVLKRRELENYLLCARAIQAFIKQRKQLADAPEMDKVEEAIQAVAEDLREEAVRRRVLARACKPFIPDRASVASGAQDDFLQSLSTEFARVRGEVDTVLSTIEAEADSASVEVDNSWKTAKLDIVPGEELITGVLKRFDINFRKSRDAPQIARLIPKSEISSEMRELLLDIVS